MGTFRTFTTYYLACDKFLDFAEIKLDWSPRAQGLHITALQISVAQMKSKPAIILQAASKILICISCVTGAFNFPPCNYTIYG